MPLVFKTDPDSADRVEIVTAGLCGAFGKGGVLVERASQSLSELQEKDDNGALKLDEDGDPIPLTGKRLEEAAKAFAQARGLVLVKLSEDKVEGLPQEMGVPADRPPLIEVWRAEKERGEAEEAAGRAIVEAILATDALRAGPPAVVEVPDVPTPSDETHMGEVS